MTSMSRLSLLLLLLGLVVSCPALSAADGSVYQDDPWFTVTAPEGWRLAPGEGYVQLNGPGGVFVRLYAIGLRSIGGKYRNLEHAVDDLIFQVRDELGGTVTAKRDMPVTLAAEQKITARGFDGSYQQGKRRIDTRFLVLPHPATGMVLSIQHAGPPKRYAASEEAVQSILATITFRQPRPAEDVASE